MNVRYTSEQKNAPIPKRFSDLIKKAVIDSEVLGKDNFYPRWNVWLSTGFDDDGTELCMGCFAGAILRGTLGIRHERIGPKKTVKQNTGAGWKELVSHEWYYALMSLEYLREKDLENSWKYWCRAKHKKITGAPRIEERFFEGMRPFFYGWEDYDRFLHKMTLISDNLASKGY